MCYEERLSQVRHIILGSKSRTTLEKRFSKISENIKDIHKIEANI